MIFRARGTLNSDAARLGRHRRCARLPRAAVRHRELWRPDAQARQPRADGHLPAVARHLLHILDLLRLGRARITHRLRLPRDLCRPNADGRAWHSADPAHRAARQGTEHHLDRRLHRGALRQASGGGGNRCADRDRRHDSLHRAAAQSRVGLAQHDSGSSRHDDRHAAAGAWRHRAVRRARDGGIRGSVRHAPHRCDRAPGRAHPGDRNGVAGQARRVRDCRRIRHLLHVRRAGRAVHQGDGDRRAPRLCSRASRCGARSSS